MDGRLVLRRSSFARSFANVPSCQRNQLAPQPIRRDRGQDAGDGRGQPQRERRHAQQPEHAGHEPHVQPLAAVVGGEEDRAAAGQHVERVQPVGRLVAEQPGRDAVEQPQAKEGRDQHDERDLQPGVASQARRGDAATRRRGESSVSPCPCVAVSPCLRPVSPCPRVTLSPCQCLTRPSTHRWCAQICLMRQDSRQCSSQAYFITRS